MAVKYVAIRDCFYGPKGYHTLFQVGDYLPEGWEPGKHFVREGDESKEVPLILKGPGDDVRSTKQIVFDLKAKFGIDATNMTRKEAFWAWMEAEEAASEPVVALDPVPGVTDVDPMGTLRFGDLTFDDIQGITAKNLIASMSMRFDLDVKHAGKSKAELVELGKELESKQLGARAAE